MSLVTRGTAAAEIKLHADATGAELIVMGRGGRRGFRELFLGSTAERVLRGARQPVQVTRLPTRVPYLRPLAALDLDEAAAAVLVQTLRLLAVPRPPLTLLHACAAPFHGMSYSSLSPDAADAYRDEQRMAVNEQLAALAVRALAGADPMEVPRWRAWVREGAPRTVIPAAAARARADLLALGTHGLGGARQVFLGSVAGDVLRQVTCDVLVVPPRGRAR